MPIPAFTVGVTGRRALPPESTVALEQQVYAFLEQTAAAHPGTQPVLLSSLAAGADQLCARAALALGYRLVVPLPLPLADYAADFSPPELVQLKALLSAAQEVFVAPPAPGELPDGTRDFAYRQAGLHIARHCGHLLALWDGALPENTCGTAAIAAFAQAAGVPVTRLWAGGVAPFLASRRSVPPPRSP